MASPEPLFEMRDVRYAYGETEALGGVTLRVEHGERVAVVGPNGAGKSTLLRAGWGALRIREGSVRVEGRDLGGLPRRQAARVVTGLGSDDEAPFAFCVWDTVALGRLAWKGPFQALGPQDRACIEEALAVVDLVGFEDRPLPSLSRGERRRAAIARCLAQEGRLLLLDEPTAHLDLGHRLRVLEVLARRARERGQGVLAVLHDLNLAALWADRVVLLVRGRIAAEGSADEVFTAPRLASAFGARVHVLRHPSTGGPVVAPIEWAAEGDGP